MTKKTKAKLNKSAWIRNQPATIGAADVVAKAKKECFKLTLAQVYTARSNAKVRTSIGKVGRPRKESELTTLQRQFAALAVRIGTDEAERILESLAAGRVTVANDVEPHMVHNPIHNGMNSVAMS